MEYRLLAAGRATLFGTVAVLSAAWCFAVDNTCPGFGPVEQINLPSQIIAIGASGSRATTLDNDGLTVWSLADPDHPTITGSWTAPRGPHINNLDAEVVVDERGYAYAVRGELGLLTIFDIRHPNSVRRLWWSRSDPAIGDVYSIALSGNLLAVATRSGSFDVALLDVTEPWQPRLLNPSVANLGSDVAFAGELLVVLHIQNLGVYDVSDPAAPALISSTALPFFGVRDVVVENDVGIIVEDFHWASNFPLEVHSVDLTDPTTPLIHDLLLPTLWHYINDVELVGRTLLASGRFYNEDRTLSEIDLSDPANPELKLSVEDPQYTRTMAYTGGLLYGASSTVRTFDPDNGLSTVSTSDTPGFAEQFAVGDGFGALTDGPRGLVTFDLSVPDQPEWMNRLELPGHADDVVLTGTTAYVALGWNGVAVVDCDDPTAPSLDHVILAEPYVSDVDAAADLLAIAIGRSTSPDGEVRLFDITVPDVPDPIGEIPLTDPVASVAVSQDHVLATVGNMLYVIDPGRARSPSVVATLELDPDPFLTGWDIAVAEERAFVAMGLWVTVVDLSTPTAPSVVTTSPLTSVVRARATGSTVVASGGEILVIDASNPDDFVYRTVMPMRNSWGATASGGQLYVASAPFFEVMTLDCEPPIAEFEWSSVLGTVWFRDLSRYWVESRIWDFGDGEIGSGVDPWHQYDEPGIYQVTLVVSSAHGTDSITHTVVVLAGFPFADDFESGDTSAWSEIVR